jgi:hypothetical protein
VVLGALSHASLPGAELIAIPGAVDAINRDRQDWIVYHFFNLGGSFKLPGLTITPFLAEQRDPEEVGSTGPIDVHLQMREDGECFAGTLSYNRELFDRPMILHLIEAVKRVLTVGANDPSRRLQTLLTP